ncbi:MAG: DNA repair protein RecO [Pseudomonadota bacterium]
MSVLTLNGFVIHRRPYRETSLLVDFFTLESGRITAVVKGVRSNSKSSRKSLLQPLQRIQFDCIGRTNLKNLTRVEAFGPALNCRGNALYASFYLNEVLQRALPESEPVEHLFEMYQHTLEQLTLLTPVATAESENMLQPDKVSQPKSKNTALEPLLREFELTLLMTLGYLPDLSCDSETLAPVIENAHYQYFPEKGLVSCANTAKHAISGEVLHKISNSQFSRETLAPAKYICRSTLPLAIGNKPIKSRELFV